jgi:signal transduction histidine kinase
MWRRVNSTLYVVVAFVVLAAVGRWSVLAMDGIVGFSPAAGLVAAVVGIHWERRRRWLPLFAALGAVVAFAFGAAPLAVGALVAGALIEVLVALCLLRRYSDPLERPETAEWWARWAGAAGLGALLGSIPVVLAVAVLGGYDLIGTMVAWTFGHGGGMLIVAPGIWAGVRWQRTGGTRHAGDIRQLVLAFVVVSVASIVGGGVAFLVESPVPLVLPVLALGWLAMTAGHRVTVMASSSVATVILLAVPWWNQVHQVSTVSATVLIVLGHAAASGLAIESSARWHARALLAGVVDIASEAVLIVDPDGRVMTGNPAARQMFGDPLEGRAVSVLLTGLNPDWTTDPPSGLTMDGRTAAGRRFSVEVTAGPVDTPGRPMMALVCRDMTEVKAAAAAIRRSAEIIDATPDLVGWTDREGSLLFLNRAGRAMMGAAEDEVIDSWAAAGLLTRTAIDGATANGTWHGETELLLRNDIRLPVAQTVIAHRSEDGAVRFYSIIARDISERYAFEVMKDEFVANVTHELRSPLTGVIGYLDLLRSGAFGEVNDDMAAALADVDTASHQMLELINDLLDLWRAEGRAAADMVDLHLGEVVEAAVRTVRPVAAGKRIALSFDTDELVTMGDRRQLERAFLNVVSNAVKFTPVGGSVAVTVRTVNGRAEVRVTDSGVGIPAAEAEAVFQRFYRASTAEKASIPGTGLGLPLVREVIRSHGGDAVIESVVGEGTTFVIDLPILVRTGRLAPVR